MQKIIIVSTLFFAFVLTTAAFAVNFSADQVVYGKNMPQMTSKIFSSGNKFRAETDSGGMNMIIISRMDKKVSWTVMVDKQMYMENSIDPKQAVSTGAKMPGEKREKLGNEVVNGINCAKYKLTYQDPSGPVSVYMWESADKMPIKSQAIDGSWTSEMRNISKAPISPSVFEVPAGYKKMPAMGAGLPGGNSGMDLDAIKNMMGH